MKRNFFYLLLFTTALCIGAANTQAQSLTRVKQPEPAAKPAQKLAEPVNFAQPAQGFDPKVGITTNVPKFSTEAEKRAYDEQRKNGSVTTSAQKTQKPSEVATKPNDTYAKLVAYEQAHLKGIDVSTKEGQLKRMEVQKSFYLANGDAATAAKIDAAIQSAK